MNLPVAKASSFNRNKIRYNSNKFEIIDFEHWRKIREARNFHGLTQKELGLKAGISEAAAESTISQYERGVKAPKNNLLNRIADAL